VNSSVDGTVVVRAVAVAKSWPGGGGLAPVDFDLTTGILTVLRGRSGSGKSTLLAILAGWSHPSSGHFDRHESAAVGRWSGTAIVPQAHGLTPELSVIENVELPLRLGGRRSAAEVTEVLGRLDLAELGRRLPHELSLGQRQRVALARALVATPTLLLIDEPTSHQDADHAAAILAAIRAATDRGAAALIATHDPTVFAVADTTIDLDP
jgi:putative ABC transport system ATP-binding protein